MLLAAASSFTGTFTITSLKVSPDDQWLALVQEDPTGKTQIGVHYTPYQRLWIVSTGGGKPVSILQPVPSVDRVWLTDGRLVYGVYPDVRGAEGGLDIEWGVGRYYIYDPQGGSSHALDSPPMLMESAFSARCTVSIAPGLPLAWLQSCPGDKRDGYLRLVQMDSGQPVTITAPSVGGPLQWLPDGNRLFFTARTEQKELHLWERATGDDLVVTGPTIQLWRHPIISPDGQWVAYLRDDDRNLCIWSVQWGTDECYLEGRVKYSSPWSPDSRAIVIATDAVDRSRMQAGGNPLWDIFIIDIPDRHVTRLTQNASAESNVSWGR